MKPTHIGGQAVIEGVMMRGKKIYTLAVRTPEGTVFTEDTPVSSIATKYPILKLPILRGMVAFVESLVIGMKIISRSAEIATEGVEDETPPSKFEQFLTKCFGDKLNDVLITFSVILSIALSVGLFMLLPAVLGSFINNALGNQSRLLVSFIEGVLRITIFLIYLFLMTRSKDIRRVFMYHGAEHKTISCYEHEEPLTVENVRKHTRLHKRCGTSFLLIVMIVSIFVFMFLPAKVLYMKLLTRIIFVPVVAGISYEIIKWAGSSNSPLVGILSAPGLWLQKLTTIEPDDDQIEVAIAAMKGVLQSEA